MASSAVAAVPVPSCCCCCCDSCHVSAKHRVVTSPQHPLPLMALWHWDPAAGAARPLPFGTVALPPAYQGRLIKGQSHGFRGPLHLSGLMCTCPADYDPGETCTRWSVRLAAYLHGLLLSIAWAGGRAGNGKAHDEHQNYDAKRGCASQAGARCPGLAYRRLRGAARSAALGYWHHWDLSPVTEGGTGRHALRLRLR